MTRRRSIRARVRGMIRSLTAVSLAALALASYPIRAPAEVHPMRGRGDARIRTARYDADEVYRVHGFVGYQIDFEFEPGERFVGVASGDIEALAFAARGNHLFLKPRAAAVDTNLTILTSRREYQLDYSATSAPPAETDPDLIYVLRFEYGERSRPGAAEHEAIEQHLRSAAAERPRNLDYWYCGAPSLRPVEAWDDGVHTHLRFGAHAELPALFVANDDGSESLLDFHVEADEVVVHRIAKRFILRRGALTGCIVNRGYRGSGDRLETGTVSQDVRRTRKGDGR